MAKILIAEDDIDLLGFLKEELSERGFETTGVRNGADAVIAAVEQSFDLLLLDMLMPGLDGIQAIRVLRKVKPDMPIIGLTGYVGRGYQVQAASYDVTVLSKPVAMQALVQEINQMLSGEQNSL